MMGLSVARKDEMTEELTDTAAAHSILFEYILLPPCKRIINRILTMQKERGFKSLAALSEIKGEGKTVLISVIALGYMRLLDKKVLIIDTISENRDDSFYYREFLAKSPKVDTVTNKRGRIDLMTTRNLSRKNLLMYQKNPGVVPGLEAPVLYEEAASYDGSDFQVHGVIEEMKPHYDLILIDTAALHETNPGMFDPLILAEHADASILIVTPEMEREAMSRALWELKRNRISPIGIIMDSVYNYE